MPTCKVCSDLQGLGSLKYSRAIAIPDLQDAATRNCGKCMLLRDAVEEFNPDIQRFTQVKWQLPYCPGDDLAICQFEIRLTSDDDKETFNVEIFLPDGAYRVDLAVSLVGATARLTKS